MRATALDAVQEGFRTRVLLDLTAGVYLTPDGRRIGGEGKGEEDGALTGIMPDVEASDDPDTEPDEALDEALETLAGEL